MPAEEPNGGYDLMRDELVALRREVAELRGQVRQMEASRSSAPRAGAAEDLVRFGPPERASPGSELASRVDRRHLLGALAVMSVSGLVLAGVGRPGEAAHARATSKPGGLEIDLSRSHDSGDAVYACTSGTGNALVGECQNIEGTGSAVVGVSHGSGHSLIGFKPPGAPGDSVVGIGASGAGVYGSSTTSAGVVGSSTLGRGGSFSGGRAQLRLSPSSRPTHPEMGLAGDLFLDSSRRLWLCRGSTRWARVA